ncbi:hypothetical protein HHI36_014806 [Cryptolaemus montrouzieri]|uniref:Reverse transcriptase domain-containing protein n=1 Tax=Cryptolaemus montrouzieri TaxID=559131 RepID=A0ABD2N3U0_9CUCU
MKQKLKALGNRSRRYKERVKRYKNNSLFYKNTKLFYRTLEQSDTAEGAPPSPNDVRTFWSGIWENDISHDENAFWMDEVESKIPKHNMPDITITAEDISGTLKRSNNWAAPGPDRLHNFWWKYFKSTHKTIATLFQRALEDPTSVSAQLTGVTHLLPKSGDSQDPRNYRPITCLPTLYKLMTAILTMHINKHIKAHNILAYEQNGCRSGARGCKELLVTDYIVTKHARKKLRNLCIAWINYRKAFDSVPHSWLLKVMELYGVPGSVVGLLRQLMSTWRTSLCLRTKGAEISAGEIRIKRGIFQGDSLSSLWFCLALNPLSCLLNNSTDSYVYDRGSNTRISHQLYLDDLKLYTGAVDQMKRQLETVAAFSEGVRMQLGVEKCAAVCVRRGKMVDIGPGIPLFNEEMFPALGPQETYKYLGIQQALDFKTSEVREAFKKKLFGRIKLVLQSKLNSKAMVTALNTWAFPSITYSFGVVNWSTTELRNLDNKVRGMLTKYGMHHPHASVNRLYLRRDQGGRGISNIESAHDKIILSLRKHFSASNTSFHRSIRAFDDVTPLKLMRAEIAQGSRTPEERMNEWKAMKLHGRYPRVLESDNVDKRESVNFLMAGYLHPETEGSLLAIQDQVVPTRAYNKHIAKINTPSDQCRRCSRGLESIQHVTSSCPILAPKDYLNRHNSMAKIYHHEIALKLGLLKDRVPNYKYTPETVLEDEEHKVYWDNIIICDRPISHNRPDIVVFYKQKKKAVLLDVTIPADDNIPRAYSEKIDKYRDLAIEMKQIHELSTTVIMPMIISVNGLVDGHLLQNTQRLGLDRAVVTRSQREVVLSTTRIVRGFLNNE